MILKRDSKLVRWAYQFSDDEVPRQTSLCAFFWRAFVFVPLAYLILITIIGAVVLVLGHAIYVKPWIFLWAIVGVAVVAGLPITIAYFLEKGLPSSITSSTFVQGAKAVKGKFCPILKIED